MRWIQIINPNLVDKKIREKFVQYQTFIFEYLLNDSEEKRQAVLHSTVLKIETLRNKKDALTKEIIDIKKEIETLTTNMMVIIKDKNVQLELSL